MELLKTLTELCAQRGVSGDEKNASEKAAQLLREYADVTTDAFGNVYGIVGTHEQSKQTLLLEAHIDEVGMIVTYITDDGFLKISPCGGTDERVLTAQQVTVCAKQDITGIVTSIPPHLQKDGESSESGSYYVDIGMTKQQAEKIVSLGDRVLVENELEIMREHIVTSKALDDRSGVAAVLWALDKLKGKQTNYNISVLFAAQEETGERGAQTGAYRLSPDLAVAVDVSFAKTHFESEEDCGIMGRGVMIGVAPSLCAELSDAFINTAKQSDIPYQIEVMNGKTGTDADKISVTKSGVKTVTLSIPLKYMHTPTEVLDLRDIDCTASLIAEFAQGRCEI
ncbi:MAG: M20/M25/M40 family metallo-hydrolase [Ruminococcus sp.]|nr:M20/M25/M40 family metallo-hydrolase [Ruminococcus sp.]